MTNKLERGGEPTKKALHFFAAPLMYNNYSKLLMHSAHDIAKKEKKSASLTVFASIKFDWPKSLRGGGVVDLVKQILLNTYFFKLNFLKCLKIF